jgi:apolipoprotein N-acyltransferase
MAQAADLGGVYLLSAVIALANAALADALDSWGSGAKPLDPAVAGRLAIAAVCPLVLFAYGLWRLDELRGIPYTGSLRVGIAQGNIAQDEKWNERLRDRILAKYLELTSEAASAGAELVVWPEAALPFYIQRDMRALELTRIAKERHIDLLVGAPGVEEHDGAITPYNQAWLVKSSGDVEGPYNKIQLVPFGEYIPMYGLFGMVKVAVQSVGQLGAGTEYTIFDTVDLSPPVKHEGDSAAPTRHARFATLICYEGIFPSLTRNFAAKGPDFLVNISNDAWYGDTSAPHQHLAMAAMRSIENRLPMVRSTNTGISAFITDEGRIGSTTPLFHEDMVVETVLVRDVWSFYRVYGDVFLHLCQAVTAGILLVPWIRRRRGNPAVA